MNSVPHGRKKYPKAYRIANFSVGGSNIAWRAYFDGRPNRLRDVSGQLVNWLVSTGPLRQDGVAPANAGIPFSQNHCALALPLNAIEG